MPLLFTSLPSLSTCSVSTFTSFSRASTSAGLMPRAVMRSMRQGVIERRLQPAGDDDVARGLRGVGRLSDPSGRCVDPKQSVHRLRLHLADQRQARSAGAREPPRRRWSSASLSFSDLGANCLGQRRTVGAATMTCLPTPEPRPDKVRNADDHAQTTAGRGSWKRGRRGRESAPDTRAWRPEQ